MYSFFNPTTLWVAMIIVSIALEAGTLDLSAIWFAVGALGALIASLLGASITVQVIIFVALSALLLILLRPLTKRFLAANGARTNADRILGEIAVVTTAIDNTASQGQVKISGAYWTARSASGNPIPEQTKVKILEIVGVKVIVTPADT